MLLFKREQQEAREVGDSKVVTNSHDATVPVRETQLYAILSSARGMLSDACGHRESEALRDEASRGLALGHTTACTSTRTKGGVENQTSRHTLVVLSSATALNVRNSGRFFQASNSILDNGHATESDECTAAS